MDCFFSDVCTKYQEAAKIVNLALQGLIGQCLPGAKIIDLCEFGHTVVTAQAQKLFTKKVDGQAIDRGIAFPVCVSVNDIVCNHSPLATEELVRHYMLLCTGCWLGLFVMDCWNVSERKLEPEKINACSSRVHVLLYNLSWSFQVYQRSRALSQGFKTPYRYTFRVLCDRNGALHDRTQTPPRVDGQEEKLRRTSWCA